MARARRAGALAHAVVPALAPAPPTYLRRLVSLFITDVTGMAVFFTFRMKLLDPS
ncbi:MAG: hypothetical protein K0B00_12890 [Rhodobacteraceae bacterium]|nr:hypothetical protein [Paracoccaceae bacterium]